MGQAMHRTTEGCGVYVPIQQGKKLRLGKLKYLLKQVSGAEPGLHSACGQLEPTAHPAPSASVLSSQTLLWSGQARERKTRPLDPDVSDVCDFNRAMAVG